jgi:hypothetical protein
MLQLMLLFERQYDAAMTSGFDSEPKDPLSRLTSGFGPVSGAYLFHAPAA